MCKCTHPDCMKGCGCRLKDIRCGASCGCRGRCSNAQAAAASPSSAVALEALKLNNALLTNIVQLQQLQQQQLGSQAQSSSSSPVIPAAAAAPPHISAAPQAAVAPPPQILPVSPNLPSSPPQLPPPAAAQQLVAVQPGHAAGALVNGNNAAGNLILPPTATPLPDRPEYTFWERLRQAWMAAVAGDLNSMQRLLHPQLMYDVQLIHNGQVMRYQPPNNAQPVVAFCTLFPQAPLANVHLFPFETAQQMQVAGGQLALSYHGPCSYHSLTGTFTLQVLFEVERTYNVHLIRGIAIRFEFG